MQSGNSRSIAQVAFSPDGKIVASNSYNDIKLWDLALRQELITLKPRSGFFASFAFSPDGKILASGGSDKTIRFWNVAWGQEIEAAIKGHSNAVYSVAFSRDGRMLATANGYGQSNCGMLAQGRERVSKIQVKGLISTQLCSVQT